MKKAKELISKLKLKVKERFDFYRSEVIIVSFPKCGRTWLRTMIGRYLKQCYGLNDSLEVTELSKITYGNSKIPNILVSHDDQPFWKRPEELNERKDKYENKKVILLVRNPLDVIVSSYHEKTKRVRMYNEEKIYKGSISEYVRQERGGINTIIKFYNVWAEQRKKPKDFYMTRYEQLHQKAEKELKNIAELLGVVKNQKLIKEAVDYSSFENMKEMEKNNNVNTIRLKPADVENDNSYKVRRGKVKGYKDELKKEDITYLRKKVSNNLSDYYSFYK